MSTLFFAPDPISGVKHVANKYCVFIHNNVLTLAVIHPWSQVPHFLKGEYLTESFDDACCRLVSLFFGQTDLEVGESVFL